MLVDTAYSVTDLPAPTAESIFSHKSLNPIFQQIASHQTNESAWQLHTPPPPTTPAFFEFRGSTIQWPVSLAPRPGEKYALIRAENTRAILGMNFLAGLKGVIFDFTPGQERIGFMSWEELPEGGVKEGTRERVMQFVVGASLGLGFFWGWRWYGGS